MNVKKDKVGGLRLPNFKSYYIATVSETMWYWNKDRPIDQEIRKQSIEINLYIYGQDFFFNKGTKKVIGRTKQTFQKWLSTCKRMKLTQNPNVRAKT